MEFQRFIFPYVRYNADKSKLILILNICISYYVESFIHNSKIAMLQAFETLREFIEGVPSLEAGPLYTFKRTGLYLKSCHFFGSVILPLTFFFPFLFFSYY